jgi:hypothetical protein
MTKKDYMELAAKLQAENVRLKAQIQAMSEFQQQIVLAILEMNGLNSTNTTTQDK